MNAAQRPWWSVLRYEQVLLPEGVRTVVDPRGAATTVVLHDRTTGLVTVATVDPDAPVAVLEPGLPDVLANLTVAGFTMEVLQQ